MGKVVDIGIANTKGSQILKAKIQADAERLHMIKGTSAAKLPI